MFHSHLFTSKSCVVSCVLLLHVYTFYGVFAVISSVIFVFLIISSNLGKSVDFSSIVGRLCMLHLPLITIITMDDVCNELEIIILMDSKRQITSATS